MTVSELIDIISFLKSEYKLVAPEQTYNPYYLRICLIRELAFENFVPDVGLTESFPSSLVGI